MSLVTLPSFMDDQVFSTNNEEEEDKDTSILLSISSSSISVDSNGHPSTYGHCSTVSWDNKLWERFTIKCSFALYQCNEIPTTVSTNEDEESSVRVYSFSHTPWWVIVLGLILVVLIILSFFSYLYNASGNAL